jgi:hypothetical protein
MILVRYHIGPSTIAPAGRGVFVDEAVTRGRVLVAPDAIPRTWRREEIDAHPNRPHLLPSVIRWFEDHYTVTPEWPDECYLNHSFAPNGIWHLGFVFAARDLAAGDELTVDYRHLLAEGEHEVFEDAVTGRPIVGLAWRDSLRESTEQLVRALTS